MLIRVQDADGELVGLVILVPAIETNGVGRMGWLDDAVVGSGLPIRQCLVFGECSSANGNPVVGFCRACGVGFGCRGGGGLGLWRFGGVTEPPRPGGPRGGPRGRLLRAITPWG